MRTGQALKFSAMAKGAELMLRARAYKKNDNVLTEFREELENVLRNEPGQFKKADYGFVIPAYKNPQKLDTTLRNLTREVMINPSDIIVVDDFSNDCGRTASVAKSYGVKTIEMSSNTQKVGAQKRGLEELVRTGKEYTITLDSDTTLGFGKKDLNAALAEMEFFSLAAMTGRVMPTVGTNPSLLEKVQYSEYAQEMRLGRGAMYSIKKDKTCGEAETNSELHEKYSVKSGAVWNVPGAFAIFKTKNLKEILDKQKQEWNGEDFEHSLRLLGEGKKIGYHDGLVAYTAVPKNLRELTKQRIRWSEGEFRLHTTPALLEGLYKDQQGNPKIDRAGLAIAVQAVRDVGLHPAKLAGISDLLRNPKSYAGIGAFYLYANHYANKVCRKEVETKNTLANIALPIFRAYNLVVPTTIGYAKSVFNRLKRK